MQRKDDLHKRFTSRSHREREEKPFLSTDAARGQASRHRPCASSTVFFSGLRSATPTKTKPCAYQSATTPDTPATPVARCPLRPFAGLCQSADASVLSARAPRLPVTLLTCFSARPPHLDSLWRPAPTKLPRPITCRAASHCALRPKAFLFAPVLLEASDHLAPPLAGSLAHLHLRPSPGQILLCRCAVPTVSALAPTSVLFLPVQRPFAGNLARCTLLDSNRTFCVIHTPSQTHNSPAHRTGCCARLGG